MSRSSDPGVGRVLPRREDGEAAIAAPSADDDAILEAAAPLRRRRIGLLVWPLITFVVVIGLWYGAKELFAIPSYLLPAPEAVLPRLFDERHQLWINSLATIQEVGIGFGISIVTAIPLGLLLALSLSAHRALYPLLVVLQLIPKIAVAPLFLVWFGYNLTPKVLLTTLLTFFPLLLASISAFQLLDPRFLYLTRSMGASRWQTFRYLRLPSALPVIFAGLKTSGTIAVTAAVVAEFVGANSGLGYSLLQQTSQLNTTYIFAILVVLTVMGLLLNYLIEVVEYLAMPWKRVK